MNMKLHNPAVKHPTKVTMLMPLLAMLLLAPLFCMTFFTGCAEKPKVPEVGKIPSNYAKLEGQLGKVEERGLGLAAFDFNRDGRPDFLQLKPNGDIVLYINKGGGLLENKGRVFHLKQVADNTTNTLVSLAVSDFNNDTLPDLAVDFGDGWVILYIDVSSHIQPLLAPPDTCSKRPDEQHQGPETDKFEPTN